MHLVNFISQHEAFRNQQGHHINSQSAVIATDEQPPTLTPRQFTTYKNFLESHGVTFNSTNAKGIMLVRVSPRMVWYKGFNSKVPGFGELFDYVNEILEKALTATSYLKDKA